MNKIEGDILVQSTVDVCTSDRVKRIGKIRLFDRNRYIFTSFMKYEVNMRIKARKLYLVKFDSFPIIVNEKYPNNNCTYLTKSKI